ncbi:MAG TPA: hypothetical protein VJV78_03995 [Polyangiales bacterium]|nr:hypothetical protein [Polyangiales bacterium]
MRLLQGTVALCIAWGCAGCTHYEVLQSSLVAPPVAPPPATEQGLLDAYVGDATVTFVSRPQRAPNNDSALWVARHVLQGALTLHASQLIAFRITGFTGLHQGAMPTTSSQLRNPGSSVNGFGMGTMLSVPYGPHRFLLSADLGIVSIPSYIEVTCVSECEGHVEFYAGRQRESVVQAVGTAGYAYRFDSSFHLQFIATLQNHPTNHESVTSSEADGDVQTGPVYVGLALSVEWLPIPWLGLIPALQWPVTRSPIQYGPILGLGVRGVLPGAL